MIRRTRCKNLITIALILTFKFLNGQEPKPPEAITDYPETIHGASVAVNVLLNDFADEGHPLKIVYCSGGGTLPFYSTATFIDSLIFYQPLNNRKNSGDFPRVDTIEYRIQDMVNMLFSEVGYCVFTIYEPDFDGARETLAINNFELSFTAFGNYFRDYFGNYQPRFIVPVNSGRSTIRDSYLVLGGKRAGKPAVATTNNNHPQFGYISDFWPGPVMDPYFATHSDDLQWDRVWSLSREEIDSHIHNLYEPGYVIPEAISSWPAHGDTSTSQAPLLARFVDRNENEIYEPELGDYPWIPGDQALFLMYNDTRLRNNASDGFQLGVEVQQTAYIFDCPDDSVLYNTTFVQYLIINRWTTSYDEFYIGIITEFGIGSHHDDYYGCDTLLDAYFAYNDSIDDAFYEMPVYGASPPAQAVCFLNHPLGSFVRHDVPQYWEVMKNLQGLWSNGLPVYYGGTGATGTEITKYLYSGDPNDPEGWSEIQTNPGLKGFKKGHGAIGPFSFYPGDTIKLDIAYVFARDYGGTNLSSVDLLKERIEQVRWYYDNDTTPCGESWSGIPYENTQIPQIKLFPNPAGDFLFVEMGKDQEFKVLIRDMAGRIRINRAISKGDNLNISTLEPGIYIVGLTNNVGTFYKKLIVQ